MWSLNNPDSDTTTVVTVPTDGIISVTKPDSVAVYPYVNGNVNSVHHIHVKEGDSVYFILKSSTDTPVNVDFEYNGITSTIYVPATTKTKGYYPKMEENIMTPAESINLFSNPNGGNMGGAIGGGLGAGVLGGVLGGAILGNRGLGVNGNGNDTGGYVTPALLASSLAQVTDTAMGTTVLQTLGDIKASIPLVDGKMQLALAGASADLNRTIDNGISRITLGQALITKEVVDASAANAAANATIRSEAAVAAGMLQNTIMNNRYELTNVVRDDGDKTRALIAHTNETILNRELGVAQSALLEQRAIGRSRDVEVNVTQTVSQNQAQLQSQQQQQQQFLITNNLLQAILNQAQVAQATNQSLIIGNSGGVTGSPQTANPVNVRA